MPDTPSPLQTIYQGLAKKNPKLQEYGFDNFAKDMQNEDNLKKIYQGLASKNPKLNEYGFDAFKNDMYGGTQQQQSAPEQGAVPSGIENETPEERFIPNTEAIQDSIRPQIDPEAVKWKDNKDNLPEQQKITSPESAIIDLKINNLQNSIKKRQADENWMQKTFAGDVDPIEHIALNLYERSKRQVDAVTGVGGTGVGDVLKDRNFYTLGATDLTAIINLKKIANKINKNEELTDSEKTLLDAWATNEEVNQQYPLQDAKRGYEVGKQVTEMVPWLAQFYATGGAGRAGIKGIEAILKKGAQKYLGKTLGKVAAKGAAEVGGAYAASALMPQTYGDIIERSLGDTQRGPNGDVSFNKGTADSAAKAIYKGWTNNMLEVLTERMGEGLGQVIKMPKVNLFGKVAGESGEKAAKAFSDFTKAVGWNGVPMEYFEEWVNVPLNALLVGDSKYSDMFDTDQQLTTLLTVTAMGGPMALAQTGMTETAKGIDRRRSEREYQSATNLYNSEINEETRNVVNSIVDNNDLSIAQQSQQLHNIISGIESDEQAGIILNYVVQKLRNEGVNSVQPQDEQPQQPETITPEVDTPTVDPRQTFEAQVRQDLQDITHMESGNVEMARDDKGNQFFILEGSINDPDGLLIVRDMEGNTREIKADQLPDKPQVLTPDEYVQGELSVYDNEQQAKDQLAQNSIVIEGQRYFIHGEQEEGKINLQPIDESGKPAGPIEQIDKEEFQGLVQNEADKQQQEPQQEGQPQEQPKQTVVNTIPIGKTEYKYTVDEAGTFDIQIPEGLDPAKAEKEIRATLPKEQQNRVQVIQEEIETPPAVPWGMPTKENVVKMIRILPISEQKDTTTPGQDNKETEILSEKDKKVKALQKEISQLEQDFASQRIRPEAIRSMTELLERKRSELESLQKPETSEQKTNEKLTETGTNVEKPVEKLTETKTPQAENQPIDISETSESLQKSETEAETGEQKLTTNTQQDELDKGNQEDVNTGLPELESQDGSSGSNIPGAERPLSNQDDSNKENEISQQEGQDNQGEGILPGGTVQSELEQKRADIERRRQEEVNRVRKDVEDKLTKAQQEYDNTTDVDKRVDLLDGIRSIKYFRDNYLPGEIQRINNKYDDELGKLALEKAETEKTGEIDREVQQAESEVNTNPTEAQKKAGNYKKGHVNVNGFDITIETPQGAIRKGDGWQVTMNNSYGYYNRTNGTEGKGEQVDVFLGPDLNSDKFFIVDQINKDGSFDEHKVMQGFNTEAEAREAYLSNYEKGWKGLGAITELNKEEFSKWLKQNNPNTKAKRKPVSEMITVKKESEQKQGLTEPVTEGEDTRDGSTYYLVKLNQEIDDRAGLNKLAKEYKGGYSKFAKGYLFRRGDNPQENAEKFRQAVEQKYSNDEYKEPRSTEAIESEVKAIENEVETVKDSERAGQLLEEIDDLLSDVEANLTLKQEGYSTEGINHELPNIEVAKRIKKDVTKFSKTLAKGLGWEHDTDRRGKKEYAHANIAPAGGDATFILWKPNSEYGVYVSIPYNPDYSFGGGYDNYTLKGILNNAGYGSILWRITSKDKKYTGFGNQYAEGDISVGEFVKLIQRGIKPYEAREQLKTEQKPKFLDDKLKEVTSQQPKQIDLEGLVDELKEKGEAKLSDHVKQEQPVTPLDKNLKEAEDRVNKKKQEKKSDYGKNNKIFTEDAANKARELLRKKLGGQLSVGIDPEIFTATVQLAGYHIEAGVRKFADFARVMVEDIGNGIKPYLKGVYENIRLWPGMQEVAQEMDSQDTVNNFDLDKNITNLAENQRESETKDNEDRIIDKQNKDQNGDEQKTTDDNQADMDERTSAERTEGVLGERDAETNDNKQRGESEETGRNPKTEERETPAGRDRGDNSQRGSSGRGGLQNIEQKQSDTGETVSGDTERSSKLKPEQQNHTIEADDTIVPGGEISKIRANIKAIKLVKSLEKNNKNATPEEKKILAQYVGWGGLAQVFKNEYWNESWKNKYGKFYNQLNDLLTPEELSAAKESTINAHYTDRSVIDAMWKMVEKMGFKGGRVIEPAGGIGHFFGLMPKNLQDNSQLRGVELDKISGLIFSKLYPQAKIDIKGFEQVNDPNNHYDLAITNVPFAGIHVHDSLNKDISKDFTLHNYFIAKSVRLLKPGGVGVFITTSSTMDNEGQGYKFRQWLHSNEGGNADLVDAIRLPNNAFKENAGTEVTTDILFIRKRDGETKHPLAKSFVVTGEYGEAMTKEVVGGYRNGRFQPSKESQKVTIRVNEFYLNNPDRMLGQMKLAHEVGAGGLYNPDQPTLHAPSSLNVTDELNKIADNFHENVFKEQEEVKDEIVYFAKDEQREGQLVTKDGKSYIVEFGILADTGWNTNNVIGEDKKKYTKAQVVDKYNEVKEAVIDLVNAESNPDSNDEQVEQLRKELNKVYDNYVKTIGNINGNRKTYFLRADVDYSLVSSLEELDKVAKKDKNGNWHYEDVVKKADIFSKRTNKPRKQPDRADNLEDAIDISNAYRNGLDINYISQLLNRDKETIQKELLDNELAYENPLTGIIEDRDTYLSGWVRKKLKHAEEAAQKDDKYNKNVEALRKVIPKDIPLIQIHAQIGASWIPNDIVSGWIDNLLEVKGTRAYHNKVTDQWSVSYPWETDRSIQNTNEHAAGGFEAKKLILDALNQRQPIAYDIFYDGDKERQVKNEANTIAAQNKIGEFKVLFQDAIWDLKGDNATRVVRAYNDIYNAWVNKNITIPKNLKTFPGAVSEIDGKPIELRTHQKIAVKKALQGATMFAHQVGTGKTFSLITTAMEMKRLGIAKKPVIVVQRATTSQFVSWFRKLYPGAKLLVPDSKDLEASERKRLFAKIGLNEWDAVILYHDFLTRIPDKPERQIAYIRERIAELVAVSADEEVPAFGKTDNQKEIEKLENEILEIQERDRKTQESIEDKSTVKNKAKRAVSQRSKLQRQFDRATDQVLYFEDMGIDALLVDEAHTFKRLGLATKGGNVKGIDTSGSQKSLSAKLKTRFILENNNNKNVVFATGTPISNTMAEAYTMMNYLIPDRLSEHGVNTFDDFRTTFGHIRPSLEFTAAGNFKSVDRFAEYINLPELQRLWQSVADVVLTEEIDELKAGVGTPVLKDNSYTQVHIKQTDALANMMEGFKQELKEWENLPGKEKRALRHVPLVIFNQAKRAAVDVRLVDSRASDDPGSKVNIAVERAYDLYKESNKYKGTQLIFSDVIESSDGRFNLYQEVKKKLIAKGVPEKEIQIISDHDTDAKREKLFDNVNNGKVRFLIGSTDKMGIGVNVQERLKAVHHLDAPARPMDFEQRNGRLLRQGNLHLEMDLPVEVFLYGVEKTLDATAYQRLAIKQKFIRQMMKKGISSDRTLEDEDVDALGQTFDQMMANLSGSQYAIIHIKKSYDLRMAEMDKRNYERKQIDANDQISQNIYQNERLQNAIEIAEKRIEYLKKNLPEREVTSLKISGGKEVKEDINKYLDDYSDEISGDANKLVFINGKIKGRIIFLKQYAKDPVTMRMSIEAGTEDSFDLTSWNRYKTARGLFQKMFERIDELPGDIVRYKEHIAKNLSDNEKLHEIINQKYPKQNKLDELAKEVAELEVKMQEETSDKVKEIDKKIKDDDLTSIKEVADIPNLKLDHDLAELFYKNSDNFDKIEDEHYDSLKELGFIDQYGDLTEKGERFVDLVDKRKETRRRAKLGIDLFPGSTNIPEITGEDVDYTGVMFKKGDESDQLEVKFLDEKIQGSAQERLRRETANNRHKDVKRIADRLSKELNKEINIVPTFLDLPESEKRMLERSELLERGSDRTPTKGYYNPNTDQVWIISENIKSPSDAEYTILHELVGHYGLRELLGDRLRPVLQNVWDNMTEAERARIQEVNPHTDDHYKLAEEYLANRAELDIKPSWWQKVISEIRDILRKVFPSLKITSGDIDSLLAKSKRNLQKDKKSKFLDDRIEEVRAKVIGERGARNLDNAQEAGIRLKNLSVAREMENTQKTPKEIKAATGWERGTDNKWRYELPDIELKMSFKDVVNLPKTQGIERYSDEIPITDAINDNELFTAYPELKNYKIIFYERTRGENRGGYTNPEKRIIGIGIEPGKVDEPFERKIRTSPNDDYGRFGMLEETVALFSHDTASLQSLLSHEIQHSIQQIEGFNAGGNISQVWESLVKNKMAEIKKRGEYQTASPAGKRQIAEDILSGELGFDTFKDRASEAAYMRIPGEVEARNVQRRITLTPEQRRNILLSETEDISREDQKFINDALKPEGETETLMPRTEQSSHFLDQSYLERARERYKENVQNRQSLREVIEGMREFYQDTNLPIRRMEEEIKKRGGKQENNMKPYRDMNLSFGRMEELYRQFTENKMKPILEAVSELVKSGINSLDVLPYIVAKHGLERNKVMRLQEFQEWKEANENATEEEARNHFAELEKKDYSGVSGFDPKNTNKFDSPDELAEAIINDFENKADSKKVKKMWDAIENATGTILNQWLKGGQISQKQYDRYKEMYKNFVPLRGWRHGAAKHLVYVKGEGFGRSLRHAEGRKTLADNPLAYIQAVGFKSIGEMVDNEVKQSMLNLVLANYGNRYKDLYRIKKVYYIKGTEFNEETGQMEDVWDVTLTRPTEELFTAGEAKSEYYREHMKLRSGYEALQHEVIVKRPGGDVAIVFDNDMLPVAQAMNRQNIMFEVWASSKNEHLSKSRNARDLSNNDLVRLIAAPTNFMKAMFTSKNPVFPFTNFFRDYPEAALTQFIQDGTVMNPADLKGVFAAVSRHLRGKADLSREIDRQLKDFYELGGATGFTHEKSPERIEKELERDLKRLFRSSTLKGKSVNLLTSVIKGIETWNSTFEDATRFAVYRAALKAGKTKEDAAIDAKEASVNFNRKGKGTKFMDAIWAFFNPAVQAAQKNFHLAKTRPKRFTAVALSVVSLGFLEAMLNDLGDDDDKYYDINEWVRHNYALIPQFWSKDRDKYLRIPLPQFWRGFHSLGVIAYDLARGKTDATKAAVNFTLNFLGGLSPIDIPGFWKDGEFSIAPLVPTAVKPFYEANITNRDFMGSQISKEPFTKALEEQLAASSLHKRNVNPAIKAVTDFLSKDIGGKYGDLRVDVKDDKVKKLNYWLDWNPSKIEHILTSYTGGTGKVLSDATTTLTQLALSGEEVDINNIPFINSFIRSTPEKKWNIVREYYDLREMTSDVDAVRRAAKKNKDYEKYRDISVSKLNLMSKIFKMYDDKITDLVKEYGLDSEQGGKMALDLMQKSVDRSNKILEQ